VAGAGAAPARGDGAGGFGGAHGAGELVGSYEDAHTQSLAEARKLVVTAFRPCGAPTLWTACPDGGFRHPEKGSKRINIAAMTGFNEPASTQTALLLLGRGTDSGSERGVDCPGELPAPSDPDLVERARAAKE
ncbi:hypothetical protein ADL26_13840, partial [Thermoactinomyces vulgaris]